MQQIVRTGARLPRILQRLLPAALTREITEIYEEGLFPEEIRLRTGRSASVRTAGENRRLATVLERADMEALLLSFCEGSVYAHGETLREGFLTLPSGIRVGVCGRAVFRKVNLPASAIFPLSSSGCPVRRRRSAGKSAVSFIPLIFAAGFFFSHRRGSERPRCSAAWRGNFRGEKSPAAWR